MDKKKQRLNLAEAVASPVLTGKNDKYVWTGLPKSENINFHLIPDEKLRNEFIKKVKDVEISVARYKNSIRPQNSILKVNTLDADNPKQIEAHILSVCTEIKNILNI